MPPGAPLPPDEKERVAALHALHILDTPPEERFERVVRLAHHIFQVPIVLISLVDTNRQWFKACYGLSVKETPREQSFCAYTLHNNRPLLIPDTLLDPRFKDNPFVVGDPYIRSYAGYPIQNAQGYVLGTLCIIDRIPRPLGEMEQSILHDLADIVTHEIDLTASQEIVLKQYNLNYGPDHVDFSHIDTLTSRSTPAGPPYFFPIFEHIAIGIAYTSLEGCWLNVNQVVCDITGYSREEMRQLTFMELTYPEDLEESLLPTRRLLRNEIQKFTQEKRYIRKDGSLVWVHLTVALLRNVDKKPLFFISTIEDINARKCLEEERNELLLHEGTARTLAEETNEHQTNFISIVSHEFRTTLTGIRGFSEILCKEDFTPGEMRDFAHDIYEDSLRLIRMINDLLDMQKMKDGRTVLHYEPFPMQVVLQEQIDRSRITTRCHMFHLHVDENLPPIEADRDKISQVIANLLSNAIKYSPQGGAITVRCQLETSMRHLQIQDQGMGIPSSALDKIFDTYSRIYSAHTRYIQGSGLGLSIVQQIVHLHNGKVWAESSEGCGATFHVLLPLRCMPTGSMGIREAESASRITAGAPSPFQLDR